MPNQPLPRSTPPAGGKPAPKTAIPVSPQVEHSAGKKQMMNMIIIITILFFGGSAVYIFGKGKLFGTDGGDGGGGMPAIMGNAKPSWETPREPLPMGTYTSYFGKAQTYIQKDKSGAKRGLYYYLHSPAGASPMVAKRYPLVIFLHDEKGTANGAVGLLSQGMQKNYPAYVLVPMAPARKTWSVPAKYQGQEFTGKAKSLAGTWSPRHFIGQSLDDVMSMAATLMTRLPIDDGRVYIVGCGEGGIGVYGALANYPDFFAGGVAASALWSFNDARKLAETPLLIIHGGKDPTIPHEHAQMMGQVIQQVGGKQVAYQEFPDLMHNCDDPRVFSSPVWGWLFQQKKPALPAAPAPAPAPAPVSAPAGAPVESTDPDAAPQMMPEMQKPPAPPMTAP